MKHPFCSVLCFLLLFCTGTLRAQIVYSDYSDPDVCCGTEDDYWLTASSFQCVPGLPLTPDGTRPLGMPVMVYDGQTDFAGSKTGQGNHTVEE